MQTTLLVGTQEEMMFEICTYLQKGYFIVLPHNRNTGKDQTKFVKDNVEYRLDQILFELDLFLVNIDTDSNKHKKHALDPAANNSYTHTSLNTYNTSYTNTHPSKRVKFE